MSIQIIPGRLVAGPATQDLVADATAAGSQVAVAAVQNIDYVAMYVKAPFKYCFADTAANAVAAFADSTLHGKYPAGSVLIGCVADMSETTPAIDKANDSLWIEADTASADITDGYTYSTFRVE